MVDVLNIALNAAAISALYALVALGFTLIFGVGGVLNLAHGALITVGAFAAQQVFRVLGLPLPLAVLGGILAAGTVSGLLYLGVVRFIQDQTVKVILSTVIIGFLVRHAVRIVFGTGTLTLPQLFPGSAGILGESVQNNMVFVFCSSWVLILALFALVNYTTLGKAILATSMSDRGAALVGIDATRINTYTWLLAGMFAGFAGVLLTSFRSGGWRMGLDPMVLSFAIVVLGGLGSIRGSVLGAYIIGTIETVTVSVVDTRLTGVVPLLILIAVLVVRPQGLFGRAEA
ncbi:branched-chain amino acid ABC transporter permease [Haloglomus halophilum]|uniref:branched-chain amino acid ABC transporter permease n=1 Tax=Haloglomus halophilum TaxID=2962672 RepID=UPI0020C9698D|nr:branched-chain amino acid ABC transporter permease [Haloglomus halophilum]